MKQTELWVFTGRAPVHWTIPFTVIREDAQSLVTCYAALPTLEFQRDAISQRLSMFGKHVRGTNFWHIDYNDLERVGHRVDDGADPQRLWSWNLPRLADAKEFKPEERIDRDDFIDSLFDAGIGESRDQLHLLWNAFCKHALDWLLNKQRPLDMYFMQLQPTPYRANWKEILCARFPAIWREIGNKNPLELERVLLRRGFLDEMLSLDLLAINAKSDYCYRRVEVEYRPAWWKAVALVESARVRAKTAFGYAASVTDSVKRNLKASIRLLGAHFAQISRPSVAHVESKRYGAYRFRPHIPVGRRRPAPAAVDAVPAGLPIKQPAFAPARPYVDVSTPDYALSELPGVRSQAPDVRQPQAALSESGEPSDGAGGVPVLHADQGADGGQLLDGRTDSGSGGLVEGTEQPSGGIRLATTGIHECASSHFPKDTACKTFEAGMNGRCVYCDHEEKCHPGPGATCEIGRDHD